MTSSQGYSWLEYYLYKLMLKSSLAIKVHPNRHERLLSFCTFGFFLDGKTRMTVLTSLYTLTSSILVFVVTTGHGQLIPYVWISENPQKTVRTHPGEVVVLQCKSTCFSFGGVSDKEFEVKWFRIANNENNTEYRTNDCCWSERGILYSEFTTTEVNRKYIKIIASKLVISNYSEDYNGRYLCKAECKSQTVASNASKIALARPTGNSKSSNDPTVSKKKGSSCCFSIRNLVAVKTIGDTEADDASVRDTETVDVSVSWNVLPSASHCNNQLESWNLTILRWNSTHDIPKHDYSIAESATAVVEVVPISCNSTNCVISHINLKKDKYYQFRLRISTSDRTDVYGSRIYYYGHEEKPVIRSFVKYGPNSVRCIARGVPKPIIKIYKGSSRLRPVNKNIAVTPEDTSKVFSTGTSGVYICAVHNILTNPRRMETTVATLRVNLS